MIFQNLLLTHSTLLSQKSNRFRSQAAYKAKSYAKPVAPSEKYTITYLTTLRNFDLNVSKLNVNCLGKAFAQLTIILKFIYKDT